MPGDESSERLIPRPSLSAATWCAFAIAFGTALSAELGVRALAVTLALAGLVALGCAARRSTSLALCVVAFAAGACVGGLYWAHYDKQARVAEDTPYGGNRLQLSSDPMPGKFGDSATARIVGGPLAGARVRLNLRKAANVELGQQLETFGRIKIADRSPRGRALRRVGILGTLNGRRVTILGWGDPPWNWTYAARMRGVRALDRVRGAGPDLLAGVLLGDRRRLAGTRVEQDFETCGLTHLIAVSGGHLVVTAGLASWLLALAGAPPVVRYLGTSTVAAAYVVFTGTQPSAVRAAVMASVAGAVVFSGRRADGLAALSVAASLMMLLWPPTVFDLGFQLSCCAVGGLVVFGRLAGAWMRRLVPLGGVADAVALTVVAQAATVPLTAPVFGSASTVAPLANALVAPLVEVGLAIGLAGLATQPVTIASQALLRCASVPLAASCWLAERLASIPGAAIPASPAVVGLSLGIPAIGAVVWLTWPQPRRLRNRWHILGVFGVCLLAAGVASFAVGGTARDGVIALDVGQGDAILVRGEGRTVLVDCGPSPLALRKALARNGVRRLDAVVITHLHEDHFGGLEGLAGVVPVGTVYGPAGSKPELSSLAKLSRASVVSELQAGDRMSVGPIALSVVWPSARVPDAATNEASLVVVVEDGSSSALLTGDAESDVLDVIAHRGALPDVDVLKVGHHGSVGAVDKTTLDALRPERAVISVGAGNRFGHPRPETLAILQSRGIAIERTDEEGDVVMMPP